MLFNEYGKEDAPALLLLHGMMQDWHSEYVLLGALESDFRLIIPAQDGFYDGSGDFTSFADQARQIEEYIAVNHGGRVCGAYGASQGGLMLTELLTRNNIVIDTAIMDGCYVAHQGKTAGKITYKMFLKFKNTGKFPPLILLMMKLMGLKEEDLGMMDSLYTGCSDETLKRNFLENYTYRVRPEISRCKTKVCLWCGSKEKYALRSHKELKQYLKNYEEEIMQGYGHGEFLMKHTDECRKKIRDTIRAGISDRVRREN